MKIPSYVAKEIFYKVVGKAEPVKTSSLLLHRGKCPLCHDKRKKRMYLKEYPTSHLVYCHNCGYSHHFTKFLKDHFTEQYSEIRPHILQALREGKLFEDQTEDDLVVECSDEVKHNRISAYLQDHAFNILEEQTLKREKYRKICLNYCINRRIPYEVYKDFYCFFSDILSGYIGIPFFDENKQYLIHIQGRQVVPIKGKEFLPKYLFLKEIEKYEIEFDKPIWGQWDVSSEDTVYICEGTLDAAAFKTGISTCGATISDHFITKLKQKYSNRVWVSDNYWTDKAGRELTDRLLKIGESCFIIPKSQDNCKDANDLILKVFPNEKYIPESYVNNNIYTGKIGATKLKLQVGS